MDLFDIMRDAGGGNAFQAMASQYGLQPDQVESAMQAFMPAFSTGLQRNTADPLGLLQFMQAISTGQHGNYYDDPQSAMSGLGIDEGNAILGHLFGSKDVSRAVAGQVDAATGIGQSILKQMLPTIASMMLGGLFKQSRGGGNPILGTRGNPVAGTRSRLFGEPVSPACLRLCEGQDRNIVGILHIIGCADLLFGIAAFSEEVAGGPSAAALALVVAEMAALVYQAPVGLLAHRQAHPRRPRFQVRVSDRACHGGSPRNFPNSSPIYVGEQRRTRKDGNGLF